jgi:hypothetical protein
MGQPPIWKASVTLAKDRAADVAAAFELAPPAPQAVLIAEDPFGPDATRLGALSGTAGRKSSEHACRMVRFPRTLLRHSGRKRGRLGGGLQ